MRLNLSFGQRLGLGSALLIMLVILTSGMGLFFAQSSVQTSALIREGIVLYEGANELSLVTANLLAVIDRMLLTRQTGGFIEERLNANLTLFQARLRDLAETESVGYESNIQALDTLGQQLVTQVEEVRRYGQDGRWAQAQILRHTELSSLQRRFNEQVVFLSNTYQNNIRQALQQQDSLQRNLSLIWVITTTVSIGVGIPVSFLVWRSTVTPINQLIAQTRQVMQQNFQPITPLPRQDEIGRLSEAFAQMTQWLYQSYHEMEMRVSERTSALITTLEVSRSLATVLNPQELIQEVVEQVRAGFKYYHVQIYLRHESDESLVLAGGTGEAGQLMLRQKHSISHGRGVVGQAAALATSILVTDTAVDPNWLPNPLLPETKAELAVPILVGEQVLGVLDVQQNKVGSLTDEDVRVMQAVAAQVGVALRNARLYEQVQRQAELQVTINDIGRQIQLAADVEGVLQVAARELAQALGAQRAAIQIGQGIKAANGRTPSQN